MSSLHAFLNGGSTMCFLVIATFFARFWRDTRDRLFAFFAVACAFMALNRALIILYPVERDDQPYVYLVRLLAFVLIAYAVIDKNRSSGG